MFPTEKSKSAQENYQIKYDGIISKRKEKINKITNKSKGNINPSQTCRECWNTKKNCRKELRKTRNVSKYFSTKSSNMFSAYKLLIMGHVILLLFQYKPCESSANGKWWNILNEISKELPEEDETKQEDDVYNPLIKVPSSGTMTEDFISDNIDMKDNIYGELQELHLYDENGEEILSEEAIFQILGQGSNVGGAKLSSHSRRKRKGDTHKIVNSNSKRRRKYRKNDYKRKNRDVSDNKHGNAGLVNSHENVKAALLLNKRILPLNKKQRRLLRNNPGTTEQISRGVREAIEECKFQFRNRKWQCTTEDDDENLFGKVMDRGFREAAFVYAITSASVAHAVAKGCAEGKIETCGCDSTIRGPGGKGWKWGGCSDNINFGMKFSREFVDSGEAGYDLRYKMNVHNNEVGRQVVKDKTVKFCKCHGMSGSCTVQTCWLRVDNFRKVGKKLRDKYDHSIKVIQPNDGSLTKRHSQKWVTADHDVKPPRKVDLVYFENSPDYCRRGSRLWSGNTSGRACNATSTGPNSCAEMCCGKGYKIKEKTIKKQCDCDFKWCCKVRCKVCHEKKRVTVCN